MFFQVFKGREPLAQPRPQDGEPRLQCCRHKLLLQRSRGVRSGLLKGTVNRNSKSNHIMF